MNYQTQDQLKTNPFKTYRDPQTGKWLVVQPDREMATAFFQIRDSRTKQLMKI